MDSDRLELASDVEPWVRSAWEKHSKAGNGSFSWVLDSDQADRVVKLTRSKADFDAIVYFSGASSHFVQVFAHAPNQATSPDGIYHAILMERLVNTFPAQVSHLANYINSIDGFRTHPMGLLITIEKMREGLFPEFPSTLIEAVQALANYAQKNLLMVELNQRGNWGCRADGTLVMFDLVHTRTELQ